MSSVEDIKAGEASPLLQETTHSKNNEYESLVSAQEEGMAQQEGKKDVKQSEYKSVLTKDEHPSGKAGKKKIEIAAPEEEDGPDGSALVTSFVLMLFFQLGNRIFGRLETYPMHNYPLFMNIISVFMYIPMSFAYIIPVVSFTDIIGKDQLEIPQYKFAVMGFLDSLAGIMAVFAINFIPNASMIVLVQQSAIPISMGISFIWLAARYTKWQYLGAAITLLGIFIAIIPDMVGHGAPADPTAPVAEPSPASNTMMWYVVLILSCVPMCFSSVYKEKALGELDIDVVYLNGWVAVYQFLFAIPLCIPSAALTGMSIPEIMPNMYSGWLCYLGYDSLESDDCSMSFIYVTSYLAFNLIYNILMILILKLGSSNILWLASTVIVPVSNVAFSLQIMPGHQPLHTVDFVSLVVVMLGLIVYRFMPSILQLYFSLRGETDASWAQEEERTRRIVSKTERKQTAYMGINQMEALNAVFDTRLMKARDTVLLRSPQQIRSSYLVRLGIAPSPLINVSPRITAGGMRAKTGAPGGAAFLPNLNPGMEKRLSEGRHSLSGGIGSPRRMRSKIRPKSTIPVDEPRSTPSVPHEV